MSKYLPNQPSFLLFNQILITYVISSLLYIHNAYKKVIRFVTIDKSRTKLTQNPINTKLSRLLFLCFIEQIEFYHQLQDRPA